MASPLLFGLSYVAGLLVSISPCVLPILPLIVGGASSKNRFGSLAMAAGLVTAFTVLGVSVAAVTSALGIPIHAIRTAGAILLIIAGFSLVLPIGSWLSTKVFGRLADHANVSSDRLRGSQSLWAQFGIGALLGAVWAPCAGPVLGGAIGLASQGGFSLTAGVQMMFFGLGTVTPLLAIAYGARSLIDRNRGRFIKLGKYAKPAFGLILLLAGVVVVSGLDNEVMAAAERVMPEWLGRWTTSV